MEHLKKYLSTTKRNKKKTIHTSRHALAEEMAKYFNELKDYGKYLGICHQYPEQKLHQIFAEVQEESKKNYEISPVKVFFWKIKQLEKIRGTKNKNLQKRRSSLKKKGKGSAR
jgi:DNA-binding TFAR19-related protein (PDSD5 family)